MRRLTLTLPDDLEARFEAHLRERGASPAAVVEDALREYLEGGRDGVVHIGGEAVRAPEKPLRFTPAERGSGKRDISVEHDRYLTEG